MKKTNLWTLVLLFTAFIMNLNAQQQTVQKEHLEKMQKSTQEMGVKLGLNDNQKGKILDYKVQRHQKIQALNEQYGNNKKDHKEEYKAVHVEFKNNVRSVLTPEQFSQWEEHMKNKKEERMKQHKNKKGNGKNSSNKEDDPELELED